MDPEGVWSTSEGEGVHTIPLFLGRNPNFCSNKSILNKKIKYQPKNDPFGSFLTNPEVWENAAGVQEGISKKNPVKI